MREPLAASCARGVEGGVNSTRPAAPSLGETPADSAYSTFLPSHRHAWRTVAPWPCFGRVHAVGALEPAWCHVIYVIFSQAPLRQTILLFSHVSFPSLRSQLGNGGFPSCRLRGEALYHAIPRDSGVGSRIASAFLGLVMGDIWMASRAGSL